VKRYLTSVSHPYFKFLSNIYPQLGRTSLDLISYEDLLKVFDFLIDIKWFTGLEECEIDYNIFDFLKVEKIEITSELLSDFDFTTKMFRM
jgi:hypothetical protein